MKDHPNYEIFEEIGRGSTATVYRAHDLSLKRDVAIKELSERLRKDPRRLQEFWEEAQFLAGIRHENIVQIHGLDKERGWIIMELMSNSLDNLIDSKGLPPDLVRSVLQQALEALKCLHEKNKLHAGVRPASLLIDDQGHIKLSDSAGITVGGEFRKPSGSSKYLAPELVNPQLGDVGPGVDLYNLGFAAIELLLGRQTFERQFPGVGPGAADPEISWMRWHSAANETLRPVRDLVSGVPEDLARVLEKLTRKQVHDRYFSADDALRELEDRDLVLVKEEDRGRKVRARGTQGPAVVPLGAAPTPAPAPPQAPRAPLPPRSRPEPVQAGPKPWSKDWLNLQLKKPLVLIPLLLLIAAPVVWFLFFADQETEPAAPLKVTVSTKPEDAKFRVWSVAKKDWSDPFDAGKPLPLKPGKYKIKIEHAKFPAREEEIVVSADRTAFPFDLAAAALGERIITLSSDPPGAEIVINAKKTGKKTGEPITGPDFPYRLGLIHRKGFSKKLIITSAEMEKEVLKLDKDASVLATRPVLLTTDPPGATVTIAGTVEDKLTDDKFDVPTDEFELVLEKKGYRSKTIKVAAKDPGETETLSFKLDRASPALRPLAIETTPPGASVFIDGVKADKLTDGVFMVPEEPFELKLVGPGDIPDVLPMTLKVAADDKKLTHTFLRWMRLTSKPSGATVYIDGVKMPEKTDGIFKVPAVPFALKLELDERTVEKKIDPKTTPLKPDPDKKIPIAVIEVDIPSFGIEVALKTVPIGANILIATKEKPLKLTGPAKTLLPAGDYPIEVSMKGFKPYKGTLTVSEKTREHEFKLSGLEGASHALLVGVNRYGKAVPDFLHAESDVETLAQALRTANFAKERTSVLTLSRGKADAALLPSAGVILDRLKKIADTTSEADTVWVALFGHVLTTRDGDFFWPAKGDRAAPETLVPLAKVLAELKRSPAKTKVLLLDGWRFSFAEDAGEQRHATRAYRPAEKDLDGTMLLASCQVEQKGFDLPMERHGLFGKALFRGLAGWADDNKDGKLTAAELDMYLRKEVSSAAKTLFAAEQTVTLEAPGADPGAVILNVTDALRSFGKGLDDMERNDVEAALAQWNDALKGNPEFVEALVKRSEIAFIQSRVKDARDDLNVVVKLNPNHGLGWSHLADVQYELGDKERAFESHAKAIELEPSFALGYRDRGYLYLKSDKVTEALADLTRAVKFNPRLHLVWFDLGRAHVKTKDYFAATNDFTQYLALCPKKDREQGHLDRAEAYKKLADTLKKEKDSEKDNKLKIVEYTKRAHEDYSQLVLIDKKEARYWNNRGALSEQLKDLPAAVKDFEKATELSKSFKEAFFNLGAAYNKLGDYGKAVTALNRAVEIEPRYVNAHVQLYAAYSLRYKADMRPADLDNAKKHRKIAEELGFVFP